MKLFHLLLLVVPLSCSHVAPVSHQAALVNAEREKVRGDNPAYYTREKATDQLFEILDFTMSPNPVIANHRVFFYLYGDTGIRDLPGLANATLQLWLRDVNRKDNMEYTVKKLISDFKPFRVRDESELTYGGPLVQGLNEMVGDLFILPWDPEGHRTVIQDIEAVARLPDDRILFAFEARVSYDV